MVDISKITTERRNENTKNIDIVSKGYFMLALEHLVDLEY